MRDGATNGFDVPGITRGEIAATLALHADTATIERAGVGGKTAGHVWRAALAVVDGVGRGRSFVGENFRGFAGRKRLFFLELLDVDGVGFGLGRLGLRFFDVETFGGIDDLGIGGVDFGRHGNAGASDEIDFDAGIAASADAAPRFAGALNPDAEKHEDSERDVEEDGVGEVAFEVEVVGGVEGVGHGWMAMGCEREGISDGSDR